MQKIHIQRFKNDPHEAQGVIEPEDRSWRLVLDKEGVPHLFLRTSYEDDLGNTAHGYFCVDDALPEEMSPGDIMKSGFGGPLSPDEEAEAAREWLERWEQQGGRPCPNVGEPPG